MIAIGLLIGLLIRSGEMVVAQAGAPAPDFTVPLLGGGEFSLSDQLRTDDRPILLNLWASWCLPCRTETPELSAFAEAHPEIKVIGVAVQDTEPQAIRFADEYRPSYDLAFGSSEFRDTYRTIGLPASFWIEPDGRIGRIIQGIVTTETLEELASLG